MIIVLDLTAAEKENLLDLLAAARDEGPPGYQWQSHELGRLRHKVETQIREQQRDPEYR
jgi:hypothetical protein